MEIYHALDGARKVLRSKGVAVTSAFFGPGAVRFLKTLTANNTKAFVVVASQYYDHPGACADATDTDDLAGHPGIAEPGDQAVTAGIQTLPILVDEGAHLLLVAKSIDLADEFIDRNKQGRITGQGTPPVDQPGQLRQRFKVVARLCFGRGAADGLCELWVDTGLERVVDRRVGLPHIQLPHRGERPRPFPVRARARAYPPLALTRLKTVGATGNREARDQALDIPFPWPRQRLVEVVDVEDEVSFWRCEQTEVAQVRVAAQLDVQAGMRLPGQVGRHDERSAAKEGERRGQHSAVSDGQQQLTDPRSVLRLQQCDGVWAVFVGDEVRQSRPRHRRPAGTTELLSFLRGESSCRSCAERYVCRHLPSHGAGFDVKPH